MQSNLETTDVKVSLIVSEPLAMLIIIIIIHYPDFSRTKDRILNNHTGKPSKNKKGFLVKTDYEWPKPVNGKSC